MDNGAALLVPVRGLDSRSYPLVVRVLDGVPSGVRAFFQGVFRDIRPDKERLEYPAVSQVQAQARAEDAGEHADQLPCDAITIFQPNVGVPSYAVQDQFLHMLKP